MDKFMWGNLWGITYLWIPIVAGLLLYWGALRRQALLEKLMDPSLLLSLVGAKENSQRVLKNIFLVLALFFSVIALMEPMYDYTWEISKKTGVDLIIALDTSKSMYASDISPSRFERSKLEIKNLIQSLEGDRVGLILFTSKAITQCPLTVDYNAFSLFLDEAEIGLLPKGGTSLDAAIEKACESFDTKYRKDRILMIVTDGETHDMDLETALKKASEAGVRIFCIGLGSREGVPIVVPQPGGQKEYVKDENGNIVLTKLEEETLKKIALATQGAYIHADNTSFSLENLYKLKVAPLQGREIESKRKKNYENRFYIPLALALIFLLLGTFLKEVKIQP